MKAISFSDLSRETEEGEETFQIKRSFFEECVRRETDWKVEEIELKTDDGWN